MTPNEALLSGTDLHRVIAFAEKVAQIATPFDRCKTIEESADQWEQIMKRGDVEGDLAAFYMLVNEARGLFEVPTIPPAQDIRQRTFLIRIAEFGDGFNGAARQTFDLSEEVDGKEIPLGIQRIAARASEDAEWTEMFVFNEQNYWTFGDALRAKEGGQ